MKLVHLNSVKKLPRLVFVLGGAASGKSEFAEKLTRASDLTPIYVATGRVWDDEQKKRVGIHQSRRDAAWQTVEAPVELAAVVAAGQPNQALLVDCATMWLTNLRMDDLPIPPALETLLEALAKSAAPIVIVSNEVGQGIVPENAMARAFREHQGRCNIALADQADVVVHVVAGLPMLLKGELG